MMSVHWASSSTAPSKSNVGCSDRVSNVAYTVDGDSFPSGDRKAICLYGQALIVIVLPDCANVIFDPAWIDAVEVRPVWVLAANVNPAPAVDVIEIVLPLWNNDIPVLALMQAV